MNSLRDSDATRTPARILYVEINEDGTVGGSYQALYDLVMHLDRRRYTPIVIFYQGSEWVERLRAAGLEGHVWDRVRAKERAVPGLLGKLRLAGRLAGAVVRRWRFLRKAQIDLIHLNNSPSVTFQDWLPAAKLAGVPCLTHARGNVFAPQRGWQRRLITKYDRVLPISQHMQQQVLDIGVPSERITLVHDGVDLDAFRNRVQRAPAAVRADLGLRPDQLLVAMVGHLRSWKGQAQVLAALQALEPATRDRLFVVFIGDVAPDELDYRAELERTIAAGLAGSARLLGRRNDVPDLMRASDIVLHASITPEPFGLVVVEALALGRPMIAASFGGPADVLTPDTGIAVDPRDPDALAAGLRRLASDPDLRQRLSAAGPPRAEDFAIDRTVAKVEQVYQEFLSEPQDPPSPVA